MTWAIVREQLRAQRGFVVTALAFVSGTVMLAYLAALVTSTQASVLESDHYDLSSSFAVNAAAFDTAPSLDGYPPQEVADIVASATRDGDRFTLTASSDRATRGPSGAGSGLTIDAHAGNTDWDSLLVDGSAPGDGEIALTPGTAEHLGVSIGDVVSFPRSPLDSAPPLELVVSGFTHGDGIAPVQVLTADAHVAWSQFLPLSEAQSGRTGYAQASWDEPSVSFDSVGERMGWEVPAYSSPWINSTAFVTGLLAGATALAAVAAALTLGRSQAQARASWVGTARALGATHASVLRAGGVEAVVLALAGSALGLALGWLAMTGALGLERALSDSPDLPDAPVATAATAAVPVVIGAALALAIALAPALWAREVTPASAIQPRPVGESVARRRVPSWALIGTIVAASALYVFASPRQQATSVLADGTLGQQLGVWSATAIAAVGLLMLAARATLWLQRLAATRLERQRRPWAIGASIAMAGRPRTTATPGLTMMPWAFVCSALLAGLPTLAGAVPSEQPGAFTALLAGTGAAVLLVAVLADRVAWSAQSVDWDAMRALGLTAASMRVAVGLRHGITATAGVLAGALGGAVALLLFTQWQRWTAPEEWVPTSLPWPDTMLACAAVIVTGGVLAAAGGAASAFLTPVHERRDAMTRAGSVRTSARAG